MNFNQWRKHAAKNAVGRVTYLCGSEPTLVELVLDDIKNILQVPATDYHVLSPTDNIWDTASRYSLHAEANSLTVVRDAHLVDDWSGLADWVAATRYIPRNYLVLISSEPDGPSIFAKGKRLSYSSHIELIRSKGKFIRCSTPNEEDLVSWCQEFGLSEQSSKFLVTRLSGEVSLMYQVLKKLRAWNGSPNTRALSLLCDEHTEEGLADCLILLDKKSAMASVGSCNDYSKIIAQLDRRLDQLMDIRRCVIRRMYDVDIAQTTGISIFLVKKFKGVAKEYDFGKVKQRRQLLAVLDAQINNGAREGVLESLIGLW